MSVPDNRIQGPNHALLVGEVFGVLVSTLVMRQERETSVGNEVVDGNYTNRIFIERPSGTWVLTIDPLDVPDSRL